MAISACLACTALYPHSGDKIGLFCALVDEIDEEIDRKFSLETSAINAQWQRFISKSHTCLQSMRDFEITYILMRDGVVVLANMASWPSHAKYHKMLDEALNAMMEKHIIHTCDAVALTC